MTLNFSHHKGEVMKSTFQRHLCCEMEEDVIYKILVGLFLECNKNNSKVQLEENMIDIPIICNTLINQKLVPQY